MITGSAIVTRIEDERGARVVVKQADDVIGISDELLCQAQVSPPLIAGGLEVDRDLVMFGTPGEGLGRLAYLITGYDHEQGWHVAERQHCTCPMIDVTSIGADGGEGIRTYVQGLDPACLPCRRVAT